MIHSPANQKPFSLPRLGLGTWPFGGGYDWGELAEDTARQIIEAALADGVSLLDTAPVYGQGRSEQILGRWLGPHRQRLLLAGKCGLVKNGSWTDHDLRPSTIRRQLEETLANLKTDYLDLYQIHYPDPHVPLSQAVAELARLQTAGKIRAIGLCNVSAAQIKEAVQVAPIFSVQNEFSLLHRQQAEAVLEICREQNISFIGYGVLCGGILSGKYTTAPNLRRADARNYFYKCYRGEAFERAQLTVARVRELAAQKKCAPSSVAIAWALARPGVSCVLFGARQVRQVSQNTAGAQLVLSSQELSFLEGDHAN